MTCKHKFRTVSNASGGWQGKDALLQCDKCGQVYEFNPIERKLKLVEIEEDD